MSGGANQRPPLLDLPPQFKLMFEPNTDLIFKAPIVKRKMPPLTGISDILKQGLFEASSSPVSEKSIPPDELRAMQYEQKLKSHADLIEERAVAEYKPNENVKATT
jgi:hypothetical protein